MENEAIEDSRLYPLRADQKCGNADRYLHTDITQQRQLSTVLHKFTRMFEGNSRQCHVNYDIITQCSLPQPNSMTIMISYLFMLHYVK